MTKQFQAVDDRESEVAYFRTNLPWVAPLAYLNVIYKPAPTELLKHGRQLLNLPEPVTDFLAQQNGAILFSGALNVYGVVHPDQLLNRAAPLSLPPYSLFDENRSWSLSEPERFLIIGGYGFDGSRICIDRASSEIYLFDRHDGELRQSAAAMWSSLDEWLASEIPRIASIFDETGHRCGDESATVPRKQKPN
jgi:hypothetical protein